ncbi:hypothetical protein ABZV34_07845, partial [Streptomyces sp. NPDC005195]|uniref:hypothetical protein n=1 Tax=Streptomyces sp. NPDC005195 TaxID=3154561 RepID=UPI0033AC5C21
MDLWVTVAASGSLWATVAASRFACAPAWSRGIDAWARAIASEACPSHAPESSPKSPSRSVALARSPLHERNAS